jgi:hypothetical protein
MPKAEDSISHERLKQVLSYDPDTGLFTWLVQLSPKAPAGTIAGCMHHTGYIQIRLYGLIYRAHRLAWFYMTGQWPENNIDHKNITRHDNRWDNLREATPVINGHNQHLNGRKSTTGLLGVKTQHGKFQAHIKAGGKNIHLGTFSSAESAQAAYLKAKSELHPGYLP